MSFGIRLALRRWIKLVVKLIFVYKLIVSEKDLENYLQKLESTKSTSPKLSQQHPKHQRLQPPQAQDELP